MGVAVITRTSVAPPLAVSARRWWTPKRCCSSTTTSAEIVEGDAGLEEGVGADQQVDGAVGEAGEDRLALAALLAAGEDGEADAGGLGQRRDGAGVLANQQLGRRHQRRLAAGLDDVRGGEQRHHRLARADVALEQAQHALGRGEVGLDLGERRAAGCR